MNLKNTILTGFRLLKDGSAKIILETMELSPTQIGEIAVYMNKVVDTVDLPEEREEKLTKSQRLRNVIYVLWEQKYKDKFETFDLFYPHYMEQIIQGIKDKLEPNE